MEPKQISCDKSPPPSSRYQSFIAQNLQSFTWLEVDHRASKEKEKDKDIEIVIRQVKHKETESHSTTTLLHPLCISRTSRYDLDTGSNDLNSFPIPTLSGRDMYVLCNNERIETFRNMGEEDFTRVVVVDKAPISSCTSLTEYFLLKCDQYLLLVIVGEVEESVEVFKLNDSTKIWEKIDCLGKHMIYIRHVSALKPNHRKWRTISTFQEHCITRTQRWCSILSKHAGITHSMTKISQKDSVSIYRKLSIFVILTHGIEPSWS
ncbi:hypothetical protein L1987_84111 [Smallanthus sonchifolius]|uniref:Uncharacterized protein n=1 Tax=Smallanthus sonchifolius TaxID=185202 RepID=A0ACB8YE10_9ASTR|nr:hypothetical protein L1987_84111 [Smallanthus sonchifolius]